MFILIWATLLFSVTGSIAETVCHSRYCITLTEEQIKAEAGLCVVIPCSFSTPSYFTPLRAVWYKCEEGRTCSDSEIIYHTNKRKSQSEFSGRVSLLEPYLYENNCSIMISDLEESDSGSYQVRINGYFPSTGKQDGFTFPLRTNILVKGLSQKPTVTVPALTAGQQTTLTCTAPGLCSGSAPTFTWTWRGAGGKDSDITGNITEFKTETLTAVTQRHSSALTFNPSAEHHSSEVSCEVRFTGNVTTEETVTLNVTYMKEIRITGNTSVEEGETLNLTCSVESFPPSLLTWTKPSDQNIGNGTDTETHPQEGSGTAHLSIFNLTSADSGQYVCAANYQNSIFQKIVNVTVIYMRQPGITGATAVQRGDVLNLTCSVESFPPSFITWNKLGLSTNLQSGTGSAALTIPEVAAEHSGQYICTAQYLDTTVPTYADVTVTWFSKILTNSGCEVQLKVLTCVCMSDGSPLPTIKWPLLENFTEYSVTTSVSNYTVNSTIILTVNDHHDTAVECVSSNGNEEVRKRLPMRINLSAQDDYHKNILTILSRLETIIAFLIGVGFTAVICCLAITCHRKRQQHPGNPDETLEMVTSQEDPLIPDGQAAGDDCTHALKGAEGGAVAEEKTALQLDSGPNDVEYASIDFSLLKRKAPGHAARTQETTETEYAEIKKERKEEREDEDGEEGDTLEGKEEAAMMEEAEETEHSVLEEEEGEDMAVYSSVKDVMDEV